ncbi:MAG: UpxY family transcription antiterminator [Rikenellaceae bacterium]
MVVDRLDIDPNTPVWFAMQATRSREFMAQKELKKDNIDSFIPMCNRPVVNNGRKQLELVPVISNLMFVYAPKSYMRDIKSKIPYIQFKHRTEGGLYYPIVVPTKQMCDFIKVYDATDQEKLLFYSPNDPALKAGKKVRIHKQGGSLDGVEGVLVTVVGKRKRQLSLSIGDLTTLVTDINSDLIEIIE